MFLELICFLMGAGLAISGSLTFWPVTEWYHFYIPIVLYIAGWLAGFVLIVILETIAGLPVKQEQHMKISKWARFWFNDGLRFILNHGHVWAKVRGVEKAPKHQRFVLVCNHRSKFDNFVITDHFRKNDIAFISKKENRKIPIAGRLYHGLCYIDIDREDKLQSLEGFKTAITLLETDTTCIGVFPEGTRQTEKVIGEFHEAPFNIAIHAKVPIVICAIKGTENIHKHWPLRPTSVKLDVVTVLNYEDFDGMTAKAVSDEVHSIMEKHLTQM